MADDQVLIKVAADINSAAAALNTLVAQMGEIMKFVSASGDAATEAGGKAQNFWDTWVGGAEAGATASVAWGTMVGQAFYQVGENLGNLIKSFPQMVTGAADAGDQMWSLANRLNVSVEALAELKYVTEQSGGSMEGLARTIQDFGRALQDSESKQAKAVKSLGLNIEELKKGKPEDAFYAVIKAIQQTIPASQQSAVAMEAFGSRFRMNTGLLKEDIDGLRARFKELGGGMTTDLAAAGDEYSDTLNDIRLVQENFRNQIAMQVLPTLNDLLQTFPSLGGGLLTLGSTLSNTALAFLPLLGNIALLKSAGMLQWVTQLGNTIPVLTARIWLLEAAQKAVAVATAVLNSALGATLIVVGSLTAVVMAGYQAWQWYREAQERAAAQSRQDAVDAANLERLNRALGTSYKTLAEAVAEANRRRKESPPVPIDKFAKYTDELKKTAAAVKALTAEERRKIDVALENGESTEKITELTGIAAEVIERYKKQIEKQREANEKAKKAQDAFNKSIESTVDVTRTIVTLMPALTERTEHLKNVAAGLTEDGFIPLTSIMKDQYGEFDALLQIVGLAPGKFGLTKDEIKDLTTETFDWRSSLDGLADVFNDLATVSGDTFGGIAKAVGQVVTSANAVTAGFDAMVEGFGAGGFSGIISGIGGIASAAAAVIPLIKGVWDAFTKSGGEDVVGRVGHDWGVKLTEEMGDAINETAKELFGGDRAAAEIFHFDDIIEAAGGINDINFDEFVGHLRDVFVMVETGKFSVEQAREVLDTNFAAFAEHIAKSNKVASAAFVEIIRLNAESGVRSQEIIDYVVDQTDRLGTALGKLMAPLSNKVEELKTINDEIAEVTKDIAATKDAGKLKELNDRLGELNGKLQRTKQDLIGSEEEMARFERIALASFNAALASGAGYVEAITGMGPALDQLVAAHQVLGTTASPAIQELLRFREVAQANQEVVESASALNEVMLALSNIGGLNAETFADLQAQGLQTFTDLTAAGFTETQALQQMRGWLESVRQAHTDLGLPIDENTQKLLDQAEAQGVLKAEGMSTNDLIKDGLSAIIEALGGTLPEAWKKSAKAATDAAQIMRDGVDDTAAGVAQVQTQLARTDWDGWARAAVDAASAAIDAVDELNFGSSPGGIKEIPLLFGRAKKAADEFSRSVVADAAMTRSAIETDSGLLNSTLGTPGGMAASAGPVNVYVLVDQNGQSEEITASEFRRLKREMQTGAFRIPAHAVGGLVG